MTDDLMTDDLRNTAAELSQVDAAIHDADLYADPDDPSSGFSDELVELVAREEQLVDRLIGQTRDTLDPALSNAGTVLGTVPAIRHAAIAGKQGDSTRNSAGRDHGPGTNLTTSSRA